MEIVKASDRTYIRDDRGTMRVLISEDNGVKNSAIYLLREASNEKQTQTQAQAKTESK